MATEKKKRNRRTPSREELDALIEDAIVDAHDESEQAMGFFTMLEEHLGLPFETQVLGVAVTVEELDLTERDIVAMCHRGRERQALPLLYLPLPDPPPQGWKWIEAYRRWAGAWR